MKLIESGQEIRFIDVDSDRVPCSLLVKLTDRTYRMTFAYNETADFFTVSLEVNAYHCVRVGQVKAVRINTV